MKKNKYIIEVLKKIINVPSPTGYTDNVIKTVEEEILSFGADIEMRKLAKGALLVKIKGKKDESLLFSSHLDTLGAMVKEIKSDGKLIFTPIGGILMTAVECENVLIHTVDGKTYSGVIVSKSQSVHVYDDADTLKREAKNMEIRLDEKVFSKEDVEKLGISVGDFVSFAPRFEITESGFVKTRFLDDKASVAILLALIKELVSIKFTPNYSLLFYFNTTEEVGAGSANGLLSENVKDFIAVDMGAVGAGQESDEYTVSICAKDSSGPYDFSLRKELVNLAKKHNIPYKVDIYPHYGSDASGARRTLMDVRAIVLGPGVESSHAYERTHEDSLNATFELLYKYILEK